MKSFIQILLVALYVISCNTAHAEKLDSRLLQSLGDVRYHELESTRLQRSLHIFIDLPGNYDSVAGSYPVIYLLDGGNTFPLLAAQQHYLRFGEETPAAILVGISYGADTFRDGNYRASDYTAPSEDRDFWGGAPIFQQVISQELIPLIENTYRADPARRVLFGHSLGGQFVLYNALTRPDLFFGHIASNPALHRNLPFFLEWRGVGAMPDLISRLFVSSGENDDPVFREPTLAWIGHWQPVPAKPWRLETRSLAGQSHYSSVPEAYRQGLKWLFTQRVTEQP